MEVIANLALALGLVALLALVVVAGPLFWIAAALVPCLDLRIVEEV